MILKQCFRIGLILLVSLASACSYRLIEIKYIPPSRTPKSPAPETPATNPSLSPFVTLRERSVQEGKDSKKHFVTNVAVSPEFAAEISLSSENCIQAVKLSDEEVVADFANTSCPETGLVAVESVVFTLQYTETSDTEWELTIDDKKLGAVEVDLLAQTAKLITLCHSDYKEACKLTVADGKFSGIE